MAKREEYCSLYWCACSHLVNVSHVLHPPEDTNSGEPLKGHVFADPVPFKLGICPDLEVQGVS